MRVIADLHIHSRFSRATSKEINLDNLEKYAKESAERPPPKMQMGSWKLDIKLLFT